MVLVAQLLLSRFPQDAGESLRQLVFVVFVVDVQRVGVDALQERQELSSGCTSFQAMAKSHNISMYKAAAIARELIAGSDNWQPAVTRARFSTSLFSSMLCGGDGICS